MTMQVQASTYSNGIVSSTDNNKVRNIPYQIKNQIKDMVDLSSNQTMKESMVKKGLRQKTYEGTINGNTALLAIDKKGFTAFNPTNITGNIGDNNVEISYKKKNITDCNFQGNYGDNSFDLTISSFGIFKTTITGTINGEPVEFNLKNGNIPESKEVQDILTTILMLDGKEAKQKNGQFTGVTMSDWSKKEQDEMIFASEMGMI